MSFDMLVDEIKKLSLEEKEEVHFLLKQYLIEEKRESFYQSFKESQAEHQKGMLRFSSDIEELKQILTEE